MPKPPNEAWSELVYAPVQPWFAQRLERTGVPVKRGLVKEEVRFKKSETAIGWTGHELGSVAEVDDEPGEDAEEHFEPALYDYRVPECLAVLYPNDVAAEWAVKTFDPPSSLETLRALTRHGGHINNVWNDRDAVYKENILKMHEDSLRSDRPEEDLNTWEKDM